MNSKLPDWRGLHERHGIRVESWSIHRILRGRGDIHRWGTAHIKWSSCPEMWWFRGTTKHMMWLGDRWTVPRQWWWCIYSARWYQKSVMYFFIILFIKLNYHAMKLTLAPIFLGLFGNGAWPTNSRQSRVYLFLDIIRYLEPRTWASNEWSWPWQ